LKSLDVILCTARNDRESVTKALSLSVTGYLIKPFAAAKVIEKVNESLKRSAAKLGLAAQAA
jgi:response regulator of citrate/malate metabolism